MKLVSLIKIEREGDHLILTCTRCHQTITIGARLPYSSVVITTATWILKHTAAAESCAP